MTFRSRLDAFEKRMQATEAALSRAGRIRMPMIFINDPEEGLEEYRLDPGLMTVQIGTALQPDVYPGDGGFNDLGILKLRE